MSQTGTRASASLLTPERRSALFLLRPADRQHRLDNLSLQAANNTPITTFGTRSLTLNLALRRTFRWIFIVGDVKTPILGADFFHGYNLLVDVRNHRLVDSLTQITVNGILTQESSPSPTMLPDKPRNEYDAILKQFPTPTPTFWRTKTTGPAHGHTSHRNNWTATTSTLSETTPSETHRCAPRIRPHAGAWHHSSLFQ